MIERIAGPAIQNERNAFADVKQALSSCVTCECSPSWNPHSILQYAFLNTVQVQIDLIFSYLYSDPRRFLGCLKPEKCRREATFNKTPDQSKLPYAEC